MRQPYSYMPDRAFGVHENVLEISMPTEQSFAADLEGRGLVRSDDIRRILATAITLRIRPAKGHLPVALFRGARFVAIG